MTTEQKGTEFQQKVWQELLKIPSGETRTYSDIAKAIGQPKAARAVGSACAANTLPVKVPCHRVVPKSGGIGNYRWGVEKKRALLQTEGLTISL